MSWANLAGNQLVSGVNLRDAVNNGLFTVKSGQTIPNNNRCLTKGQVYALVNVQQVSGNRLVQKQELIAVQTGFTWSATAPGDETTVCGLPVNKTLYSNNNVLNETTYFYNDAAMTSPVFAEDFAVQYGSDKVKIRTFTNGRLRTQELCLTRIAVPHSNSYTNLGTSVCRDTNRGVWYVNSNDYPVRIGSVFYATIDTLTPISSTIITKLLDTNQAMILTNGIVSSLNNC